MVCDGGSGGAYVERGVESAAENFRPYMVVVNCNVTNNNASITGGALFTNEADLMAVCCNCTFEVKETARRFSSDPLTRFIARPLGVTHVTRPGHSITANPNSCRDVWVGNRAMSTRGGNIFGTTAIDVTLCTSKNNCVNGSKTLKISKHTSGEDLEHINMTLVDAFGQIALGQPEMSVKVSANLRIASLRGESSFKVETMATLKGINLQGKIGTTLRLTLSFDPGTLPDLSIEVDLRDCLPGEEVRSDMEICSICKDGFYSFDPNQKCNTCPFNATCKQSTITPDPGFWHYTSQSAQIQECMVRDACDFYGRSGNLTDQARVSHLQNTTLFYDDNDKYKQCSEVRNCHKSGKKGNKWMLCCNTSPCSYNIGYLFEELLSLRNFAMASISLFHLYKH